MVYLNTMTAFLAKEICEKASDMTALVVCADEETRQGYIKMLRLSGDSVKILTNGDYIWIGNNNSVLKLAVFTGAMRDELYDFLIVDTDIDRIDIEYCIKPWENRGNGAVC